VNTGGYEDITVLFQTMFCEHVGSLPDPSWVKLINLEYILLGGERREASNVSLVLNHPSFLHSHHLLHSVQNVKLSCWFRAVSRGFDGVVPGRI